jgi:hypothetical protein
MVTSSSNRREPNRGRMLVLLRLVCLVGIVSILGFLSSSSSFELEVGPFTLKSLTKQWQFHWQTRNLANADQDIEHNHRRRRPQFIEPRDSSRNSMVVGWLADGPTRNRTTPSTTATPQSSVLLVMSDNRWNDANHTFLHLSTAINRAYAAYQGYGFWACGHQLETVCPGHVPLGTSACKLFCVRDALSQGNHRVETVVYLDSDAIVRNFSQSVHDFVRQNIGRNNGGDDVIDSTTAYDLIVPTDCDRYKYNGGLQIWRNSASARQLVDTWIHRVVTTPRYRYFPFEQQALKDLCAEDGNSTAGVVSIPYGPQTWHVGSCKRGGYIAPQYIAHITGRWPAARRRTMLDTIRYLCPDKSNFRIPQCVQLFPLLELDDGTTTANHSTPHIL